MRPHIGEETHPTIALESSQSRAMTAPNDPDKLPVLGTVVASLASLVGFAGVLAPMTTMVILAAVWNGWETMLDFQGTAKALRDGTPIPPSRSGATLSTLAVLLTQVSLFVCAARGVAGYPTGVTERLGIAPPAQLLHTAVRIVFVWLLIVMTLAFPVTVLTSAGLGVGGTGGVMAMVLFLVVVLFAYGLIGGGLLPAITNAALGRPGGLIAAWGQTSPYRLQLAGIVAFWFSIWITITAITMFPYVTLLMEMISYSAAQEAGQAWQPDEVLALADRIEDFALWQHVTGALVQGLGVLPLAVVAVGIQRRLDGGPHAAGPRPSVRDDEDGDRK